jgi:hypothetical protein
MPTDTYLQTLNELTRHFMPAARKQVADLVASGAWAGWAGDADKLERGAREFAKIDAIAAMQRGESAAELSLQGRRAA